MEVDIPLRGVEIGDRIRQVIFVIGISAVAPADELIVSILGSFELLNAVFIRCDPVLGFLWAISANKLELHKDTYDISANAGSCGVFLSSQFTLYFLIVLRIPFYPEPIERRGRHCL